MAGALTLADQAGVSPLTEPYLRTTHATDMPAQHDTISKGTERLN
jgi:hypothetical protein